MLYKNLLNEEECFNLNETSKILQIKKNELYSILHKNHILLKNNEISQEYIAKGYFSIKTVESTKIKNPFLKTQIIVHPEGIKFLAKVLIEDGYNIKVDLKYIIDELDNKTETISKKDIDKLYFKLIKEFIKANKKGTKLTWIIFGLSTFISILISTLFTYLSKIIK